ncbi:MAG: FtsX-like permease family protein [Bryobacteraceae bacterium]
MTATAFKIALREIRSSRSKFSFVIIAVAIGVASLTGVRGFSESFRTMLLREARSLMAADISVRIFGEPSAEQQAALDKLGVAYTRVTETVSMVTSVGVADPVLVSLKAVDPQVFPYYGVLTLTPEARLSQKLNPNTVVLSEDARVRLKTQTAETIIIGGQPFQVAAIVTSEPDRMSGSFNVGPRVLISREGLARTGLLQLGSRASQRFLFKIGGRDVVDVSYELKTIFPEALIVDFREINPNIARGMDRATSFLSLVSLIALIVGAIGVATSMHAHLASKLDGIALMKSIGARSSQIVQIYLIQTLLLGLTGGLAGVVAGSVVQWLFPIFLQRYFQMRPDVYFTPSAAIQGLLAGLLTTLLFTLPALLSIREIKPAVILRRDMGVSKTRSGRTAVLSGVVICLGIAVIAVWLSNNIRLGLSFLAALLISIAVLTESPRFFLSFSSVRRRCRCPS